MFFQTSDGKTIYYETHGKKEHPAIVLLHGIGADHEMWEPQIKKYPELGLYVIVPDMRGHGQSAKVDHLALSDWSRDIYELLHTLEVDSCILAGVSMGGVIAQQFAVEHPEKLQKLILCDTFGELKTFSEKLSGAAQLLGFKIFQKFSKDALAKTMSSAYKAPYAQQAKNYFYSACQKADLAQLILARRAINRINILDQLKQLKVPSLVMVGSTPGKIMIDANKKIADSLKGSKFVILDDSMDPSNLIQPEAFDREVLHFIKN